MSITNLTQIVFCPVYCVKIYFASLNINLCGDFYNSDLCKSQPLKKLKNQLFE